MAGGGVRAENVKEIIEHSGVRRVHARATDPNIFLDLVNTLRSFASKPTQSITS